MCPHLQVCSHPVVWEMLASPFQEEQVFQDLPKVPDLSVPREVFRNLNFIWPLFKMEALFKRLQFGSFLQNKILKTPTNLWDFFASVLVCLSSLALCHLPTPRGSFFSTGYFDNPYVDQADLEFTQICLPLAPESWDQRPVFPQHKANPRIMTLPTQ